MVVAGHDPYWFEDDSDCFTNHEPQRNTDYNFPDGWGLLSDEEKCEWFLEQRILDQMERQYLAGMWEQFDKFLPEDRRRWVEAMRESDSNPYRKR